MIDPSGAVQFPVFIKLRRSRLRLILLLLFHTLAALCVVVTPVPWPIQVLLGGLIGASLWRALPSGQVIALSLSGGNGLQCLLVGDQRVSAVVLPDTTIFGWLIVLRWRIEGESRVNSLPLFPDNMSTEEYRLLRICLRWSQNSALTEPAEID